MDHTLCKRKWLAWDSPGWMSYIEDVCNLAFFMTRFDCLDILIVHFSQKKLGNYLKTVWISSPVLAILYPKNGVLDTSRISKWSSLCKLMVPCCLIVEPFTTWHIPLEPGDWSRLARLVSMRSRIAINLLLPWFITTIRILRHVQPLRWSSR